MAEKFAVRETMRKMEKMKKKKGDEGEKQSRRAGSSSQVFKNLQKIVQEDYKKKEDKKAAKKSFVTTENSGMSTKRYKL